MSRAADISVAPELVGNTLVGVGERPAAKGWCPGALSPMMSGDGMLVRLRPRLGRLSAEQVLAVCAAALRHGSGVLEFTSRANIQIRGIKHQSVEQLVGELDAVDLVDKDATLEARNNILVSPFWLDGEATAEIAIELHARLAELPELPAKFGFGIDAGKTRHLAQARADIRVERGVSGGLIVRADGLDRGMPVQPEAAVDQLIAIARWFSQSGGLAAKRMALHVARVRPPAEMMLEAPASSGSVMVPGWSDVGRIYGAAFGQVSAADLAALVGRSGAGWLRTTPWRLFVLEGGRDVAPGPFVVDAKDPILRVDACPGAPHCASATIDTRGLGRALAGVIAGTLHVSGCSKGCARSRAADVTVVGRDGAYHIVHNGRASDMPTEIGLADTGLDVAAVVKRLGGR